MSKKNEPVFLQDQLQNEYEVQILQPTQTIERIYRFQNEILDKVHKKVTITTTLKTIKIVFLGIENNVWWYRLVCLDYFVKAPQMGSTTLIEKRDSIFNEVIVYVNQIGEITDVINHKQLQERWENQKSEILEKHQGDILNNFIQKIDTTLANKENILQHLKSKEMYGLFFNGCWGYHDLKKPRYKGLTINIEKRIRYDAHTLYLQKPYNQDAQLILTSETNGKTQHCEFNFKNKILREAYLQIETTTNTSKYSIVCLTA